MKHANSGAHRRLLAGKAAALLLLVALSLGIAACQTTETTDPEKKALENQLLRDAYEQYRNQ